MNPKPDVRLVPVGKIEVGKNRRPTGDVSELAKSIEGLGILLNPITVTEDMVLVAGGRRLAAVKKLEWDQVPVNIVTLSEAQAQLGEIDENLQREELTALERSEQLHRRKQLYEALHPETRAKVAGAKASNAKQGKGKDASEIISPASPKPKAASFAKDTAKKTGVSPRTVQHDVQIAAKIDHRARDLIRDTDVADSKTDLLKLAKVAPAVQVAAAQKIKTGEAKNAVQAIRSVERAEKREDLEAKAKVAAKSVEEKAAAGVLPWELITGDCVAQLAKLPSGHARLVFADPPYNVGRNYHGKGAAADLMPDEKYLAFCEDWLRECARLLTDDGSLWLLVSDEYADDLGVILRRKLGLHRRAWVKWFESFGVSRQQNFGKCSRHIFYMVKDPTRFVFNESAVMGVSSRLAVFNDKRADPDGKILDDVWGVPWIGDDEKHVTKYDPLPRLHGTTEEKIPGFDNQLPIALVRRVIECASDPGDRVLDPFNGTGTTGVAAIRTGRLYTGIELEPSAVKFANGRIAKEYADVTDERKQAG